MNGPDGGAATLLGLQVAALSTDDNALEQMRATIDAANAGELIGGLIAVVNLLGAKACGSREALGQLLRGWAVQVEVDIEMARLLESHDQS